MCHKIKKQKKWKPRIIVTFRQTQIIQFQYCFLDNCRSIFLYSITLRFQKGNKFSFVKITLIIFIQAKLTNLSRMFQLIQQMGKYFHFYVFSLKIPLEDLHFTEIKIVYIISYSHYLFTLHRILYFHYSVQYVY